jgi:predicted phosphate transport protein (TIGR00153 family)
MVANLFRFMPHEERFFDLLNQSASTVHEGADALLDFVENYTDVARKARRLKDIEHAGDEITHEIFGALHRSFITPLDREDIGELAEALDDVLDWTEDVSRRMYIYKVDQPTELARRFAHVIADQAALIEKMVPLLVNAKGRAGIEKSKQEIHRLENEADDLLVEALGTLYDNATDVPSLAWAIRWADLYQILEGTTDKAEHVATVLQNIVVKHA